MAEEILPELADLWIQVRPTALERCATVARGASSEDAELHAAARVEAHKLAGSLGMYGLAAASDLALELDAAIVGGALSTPEGRGVTVTLVRALTDALEVAG